VRGASRQQVVYTACCRRGYCGNGGAPRSHIPEGRREQEEGTGDNAEGTGPRDIAWSPQVQLTQASPAGNECLAWADTRVCCIRLNNLTVETPGGVRMSTTISVLGGVGLFLLGMSVMTGGLKALAGPELRATLSKAAATPLSGTFWGAFVTLLVQSSSATTMTTIGLVSAGLLTFS